MTRVGGSQRIAHLLPFSAVGGTEVGTARIIALTTGPDLEHVVFYPAAAPLIGDWLAARGLRGIAYVPPQPSLMRQVPRFLRASWTLARQLRAEGLTAIHCADILAAYQCGVAGRLAGYPILSHVRGRYPDVSRRDCLFLRLVDRFAFVSADARDAFGCRVAARRGDVIRDGIDLPTTAGNPALARQALGIPANRTVIGMIARIAPPKDHLLLVAAAKEVLRDHPHCHFVLVGGANADQEGATRLGHLREVLAASHLTGHFTLTGHRDDVAALLPGMDVVALVSQHEGLPLVLLEAMAQGIPVVASCVGGIPELVAHGHSGLLHRTGDAGDLAAQLRTLVTDPSRRAALGAAGRDRVARAFSSADFASRLRAFYGLPPSRSGGRLPSSMTCPSG